MNTTDYKHCVAEDIPRLSVCEKVTLTGIISEVKPLTKTNLEPYLSVVIQDKTGFTEFPMWNSFEFYSKELTTGKCFQIYGVASDYKGNKQLKDVIMSQIKQFTPSDYMPSYEISNEMCDYFYKTLDNLEPKYMQFAQAATGCGMSGDRWKKFTTAPAASKKHQNKLGGLFVHTIGQLKNIDSILDLYINNPFCINASNADINPSRLRVKAILLDIKKTDEYLYETTISRKKTEIDHIIRGVSYVNEVNKELDYILSEDEIENISYSILSHHGQWGKFEPKSLEDTLLHLVDMIDSRMSEGEKK